MKLTKKLFALLLVATLAVSLTVSAFATTSDKRINSVRFENNTISLDPGDTYTLNPIISPSDITLDRMVYRWEYTSSNTDIAHVDRQTGEISAYEPGQVTITLRITGGPSCTASVQVRGTPSRSSSSAISTTSDAVAAGLLQERSSSRSSSSTGTTTSRTTTSSSKSGTVQLEGKASREEVIACAQSGQPVSNYESVSMETLQAAANTTSNAAMFDTKSGSAVVGRLTVNTANTKSLSGDLKVGVYSGTGNTATVQNTFDKWYNNNVRVVLCDQQNYGMNVNIAVSVGNLDASNLKFYSYDASKNSYAPLTVSNVTKDSNNYLHFTTSKGGYIIVSDGTLSR